MGLYNGLPLRGKIRQWHLLHTHVWWNHIRGKYDAVYVRKNKNKFHHTEFAHPMVTLDFDQDNNLIGVEIIGVDLEVRAS